MDLIRLQQLFDSYTEKFEAFNNAEHRETYKWAAVSHFQKYWDVDAEQFGEMFKVAFEDSGNQIDVPSFQPIAGVLYLCRQNAETMEEVREAFRRLLESDGSDLQARQKRVEEFVSEMNAILQRIAADKWKYHQDTGSALLYLTLADPDNNYMYRESECKAFAEYLGVKNEIFQKDMLNLPAYYHLCDNVAAELLQQSDLLQIVDEALEAEADSMDDSSITEVDGDRHILVYDLIYCARNYQLYEEELFAAGNGKRTDSGDEEYDQEEKKIRDQILRLGAEFDNAKKQREGLEFPQLEGTAITHLRYGAGTITAQEDKYLTVTFDRVGVKKFVMPEALTKGFLKGVPEEAMQLCGTIAELDETIQKTQREMELLQIELNSYTDL
ncbi:MAG: hypothetical protein J5973_02645 [Eubacterium sp.]|nr:hypothetical protein [Eubacterium sp.]